ncbi:MAG: ABC transporter ATP-binding protein [Planctomycetota bacterium]
MIRLENIEKSFPISTGKLTVLKGINLRISKGEFVAITGPSGSGKSTLMALLGCLDRPTSGQVLINGTDVSTLSDNDEADLRSRTIGFVFQAFHLIQSLTILENVEIPLFYAGVPHRERRTRALKALEKVGLGPRCGHKPPELSGGEQQRAAIARALIREPEILLADEPTGNLDSKTCAQIMTIFESVRDAGKTVLIITHDQSIAAKASRQIKLNDGLIESDSTLTFQHGS